MVGEGVWPRVEKNFSTLYPFFESRNPLYAPPRVFTLRDMDAVLYVCDLTPLARENDSEADNEEPNLTCACSLLSTYLDWSPATGIAKGRQA